ncbi:MAG: protein TolQ [Deltaproteobacteria bacterium]|nr:protein TolQ [Deltaproteobacteria bacterium]
MIVQAEPIVQAVLYLLIGMSIACWAIILNKTRVVRRAARQNESFLDLFWKLRRPDQVYEQIHEYLHAPIGQVFKAGYVELSRLASAAGSEASRGGAMDLGGTENIARAMRRAASVQITALERMIPFLATTGATAPFIGLFGTVWGILRAFQRIGASGQASIQVVGPDIAHALVATAMGLLAAIPAVMAYNFFHSKIRVISTELDNFSADFMNIVKRHFRGA